jgi:DNA-binding MarR family transcriptional regulator
LDKNLREMMGCTCLRIRRTSRRITQVYDHALAEAGFTVNQFILLGNLYGAELRRGDGLSVGALADRLGTDPTTLNRTLKPLKARDLLKDAPDPDDKRVRIVRITPKGKRELVDAIPFWRKAQAQVKRALGAKATLALNELLDRSNDRLAQMA